MDNKPPIARPNIPPLLMYYMYRVDGWFKCMIAPPIRKREKNMPLEERTTVPSFKWRGPAKILRRVTHAFVMAGEDNTVHAYTLCTRHDSLVSLTSVYNTLCDGASTCMVWHNEKRTARDETRSDSFVEISSLWVRPKYRRMHLGYLLFKWTVSLCGRLNIMIPIQSHNTDLMEFLYWVGCSNINLIRLADDA
jgi:hypothetical protein